MTPDYLFSRNMRAWTQIKRPYRENSETKKPRHLAGPQSLNGVSQDSGQHHPAFAAAQSVYPNLHADPLHQGLHMGDDAYLATGRLQ
jgi:hypothetical protein